MPGDFLQNPIILEDMDRIYAARDTWFFLKNKNVYITGAAGMIASYIVYFLIYLNEKRQIPCSIYACVRNRDKADRRFGDYVDRPYFHLIKNDVCREITEDLKFEYMIHAASLASPQYYGTNPVDVMTPNIIGTYNILEHARKKGCDSFVFFSTGSVYGTLPSSGAIREDMYGSMDYLDSGNCYGESKRCGEALCAAYHKQYGLSVKSVRIFHTYGPTMDLEHDKRVFSEFMRNVIKNEDIVLKSDGKARRAFCYMTDMVSAVFHVLFSGKDGESYNVANPDEFMTMRQLAELLTGLSDDSNIQIVQKERAGDYKPSPEREPNGPDISKINRLGWYPVISAREGFGRCVEYFRDVYTVISGSK